MTDNFSDGRYDADTKETILDALVADAESQAAFGSDLDPDDLSIIRAHYDPVAERLAELQEDIGVVLDSSQIDHADGTALDLLAAWIGVARNTATKATGRVRFSRDARATQDYTIASGTIAQTDESDPVQFETDSARTLGILDDFNDNDISDYDGDTGDFSASTTQVHEGTHSLQASAASGSFIHTDGTQFGPGSKLHCRVYPNTDTVPLVTFAVTDADNRYQVRIDTNNGNLELEKVESGSESDIETDTSASIPTGEWLDLEIDWQIGGDISIDLDDAAGDDISSFTGTDTTFTGTLGFGFGSGDATSTKYFDEYTMSSVGADATAVDAGTDGNLGAGVLTVMPDSPNGVEEVTNPEGTSGGEDKEADDDFRARAKSELGDGIRGTQKAIIERLEAKSYVHSVSVIENDSSSTDGDGRPAHSFEAVVQTDSDHYDEVAQVILDTKGTGYESAGGFSGTSRTESADLPNGQTKDITFSTPTEVTLNADIDLTKDNTYAGDDQVRDNLVRYTGGTLSAGGSEDGELGVGDDVIYNQVMAAVAGTQGVVDVTNLEIDSTATPTGTSNITISDTEIATADASDDSLDVTSSDV